MIFKRIVMITGLIICGSSHWVFGMNIGSLHTNGILHEDAQKVFSLLGELITMLEQANNFAQKHLLRSGERWGKQTETPILKLCKEQEKTIVKLLQDLGMVDAVYPQAEHFMYALCVGALRGRVEQRLATIADLLKKGYSFDYIAILSGARPLLDHEKNGLPETVTTELEMMQYLFSIHPELKHIRVLLINAPMVTLSDGTMRRPNIDDTLYLFKKEAPQHGSCLVVSNNPYLFRQVKVALRILDAKVFPTYGAGSALDPARVTIFILMDEFARVLYEEHKVHTQEVHKIHSKL